MISARFGWPLETDSAARAMANASLGMGGKNPSIVANRYIPRYTTGEAASARIQFSTRHLSPGRRRSTMRARDPTDLTPSLTEYVFTSSGSHQARSSTLAEPDRFFVVAACPGADSQRPASADVTTWTSSVEATVASTPYWARSYSSMYSPNNACSTSWETSAQRNSLSGRREPLTERC